MADTPSSIAAAWQRKFLDDFGRNGIITNAGSEVVDPTVQFINWPPRVSPRSTDRWTKALFTASGKLRSGSAPGPDTLPPELYRAGG